VDSPLLRTLVAGAGSSSQFIGALVITVLYLVIGLLGAIGSILVFRRVSIGRVRIYAKSGHPICAINGCTSFAAAGIRNALLTSGLSLPPRRRPRGTQLGTYASPGISPSPQTSSGASRLV
jgi:hypothetical protein